MTTKIFVSQIDVTNADGSTAGPGSYIIIGSAGAEWYDGALTFTGYSGSVGYLGSVGYTGSRGLQGTEGFLGSAGYRGSIGFAGSVGSTGPLGPEGYRGSVGYFGSAGYKGSAGRNYFDYAGTNFDPNNETIRVIGEVGTTDLSNEPIGITVLNVTSGDIYEKVSDAANPPSAISNWSLVGNTRGYTGSRGATGAQGPLGYAGSTGFIGSSGVSGGTGYAGSVGYQGSRGTDGTAGANGYRGSTGYRGSLGETGYKGSAGSKLWDYMGNNFVEGASTFSITLADGTVVNDSYSNYDPGDSFLDADDGNIYAINTSADGVNVIGNLKGSNGFTGSRGASGFAGSTGFVGSSGVTGGAGFQGSVGYIGSAGSEGYRGSVGYHGSMGYTGSRGPTGYDGSEGADGLTGYTGSEGFMGSIGYTGSVGSVGYLGSAGYQGSVGFSGSIGDVGYNGSVGYTGSHGAEGNAGYDGSTGYQGSVGYKGSAGDMGPGLPIPFTDLTDVPASYVGYGNNFVRVASDASGLIFDSNVYITNPVNVSGNIVNFGRTVTANTVLASYGELFYTVPSSGTLTINVLNRNIQKLNLTSPITTITLSPTPANLGGMEPESHYTITFYIKQDATGGREIDWSLNTIYWPTAEGIYGPVGPTLSTQANYTDIVTLTTLDGGTTWYGMLSAKGFATV